MSIWYQAKEDEIEVDDDEINIYAGFDNGGNRYVIVKIKDIKKVLEEL